MTISTDLLSRGRTKRAIARFIARGSATVELSIGSGHRSLKVKSEPEGSITTQTQPSLLASIMMQRSISNGSAGVIWTGVF